MRGDASVRNMPGALNFPHQALKKVAIDTLSVATSPFLRGPIVLRLNARFVKQSLDVVGRDGVGNATWLS